MAVLVAFPGAGEANGGEKLRKFRNEAERMASLVCRVSSSSFAAHPHLVVVDGGVDGFKLPFHSAFV